MSMSMSSGGAKLDPGLGFVLAVMFFGSAIFTLASPVKGVSHHGSHAFAYASSGALGATGSGNTESGTTRRDSARGLVGGGGHHPVARGCQSRRHVCRHGIHADLDALASVGDRPGHTDKKSGSGVRR